MIQLQTYLELGSQLSLSSWRPSPINYQPIQGQTLYHQRRSTVYQLCKLLVYGWHYYYQLLTQVHLQRLLAGWSQAWFTYRLTSYHQLLPGKESRRYLSSDDRHPQQLADRYLTINRQVIKNVRQRPRLDYQMFNLVRPNSIMD